MITYGLIGRTLSHSFSAAFFTGKFANEHIDAQYLNFELPDISDLPGLLSAHPEIQGLNVTIPYKQAVIPYLDELDSTAKAIGAVNTVKVLRKGSTPYLIGYNTDAPGFLEGLKQNCATLPHSALILGGTGGAAAAVIYALNAAGISTTVVSRKKTPDSLTYKDLTKEMIRSNELIVNCTPLGTYPDVDTYPDIPYKYLSTKHIAYDLVYNPAETVFLRRAAFQGAHTINGLPMLHAQARLAYQIWTNKH